MRQEAHSGKATHGTEVRRLQRLSAVAGIVGPLLLVGYFVIPRLIAWPSADAAPQALAAFALSHSTLFYLGGWLQVTGTLLCVVFFTTLLHMSNARDRLATIWVNVGAAALLAIVLVEAALLEAVPIAASNGDRYTVAVGFALSSGGVFARIFPLAPAPMVFAGLGLALRGTDTLPSPLLVVALVIALLFLGSGFAAILGTAGLLLAVAMSIIEAVWILSAGVVLAAKSWR